MKGIGKLMRWPLLCFALVLAVIGSLFGFASDLAPLDMTAPPVEMLSLEEIGMTADIGGISMFEMILLDGVAEVAMFEVPVVPPEVARNTQTSVNVVVALTITILVGLAVVTWRTHLFVHTQPNSGAYTKGRNGRLPRDGVRLSPSGA